MAAQVQCKQCGKTFEGQRSSKYLCSDTCRYKHRWQQNQLNGKNRMYHLKKNFGITIDAYNDMFTKQGGKCAICGKHQSECTRALAVDHDHITGKIRGLLCSTCNIGLGNFKDDTSLLKNTITYLERNRN